MAAVFLSVGLVGTGNAAQGGPHDDDMASQGHGQQSTVVPVDHGNDTGQQVPGEDTEELVEFDDEAEVEIGDAVEAEVRGGHVVTESPG